jgi:predicted Fe-Mo cluster-binding NifX family protein
MTRNIAIPIDSEDILDAHFGHCKFFLIIKTSDNLVVSEEKVIPPPHEPGVLPKWLADKGVTDIIAGGMGQKAIQIFNDNKVNVLLGAPKIKAGDIVQGFLNKSIEFTGNYCNH